MAVRVRARVRKGILQCAAMADPALPELLPEVLVPAPELLSRPGKLEGGLVIKVPAEELLGELLPHEGPRAERVGVVGQLPCPFLSYPGAVQGWVRGRVVAEERARLPRESFPAAATLGGFGSAARH